MTKQDFKKINDYVWEIPKDFRDDMKVPARIYVSEKMLDQIFKDRSIEQLINVATLPGIINYSLAMPDIHEGYGFPIGGVAAMDKENGVISPGGVGYDINCGMKLLRSEYLEKDIKSYLDKLAIEIQKQVPSGLGRGRQMKLDYATLDKILEGGAKKLVEQGYGEPEDAENCEANGRIEQADASAVSSRAKNRGRDQVGTLGSGNHFLEVQKIDEIFDEEAAKKFGFFKDQIVIMIHTGSRGLGHQIATDYIRIMMQAMPKYNIKLPDRELACVPFKSSEGQKYFSAMSAGANFAWANRQMIAYYIKKVWKSVLGEKDSKLVAIYDVAHNIAKLEKHRVNGEEKELVIHRKGATRAFPNQPVLIPGSMGTASYVLVGTEKGKEAWFSTCHGAGRMMSRKAATRALSGQDIVKELEKKGILVKCYSMRGIAEEAPQAYKNIDEVVEVVHQAGLSKKVARLKPLAVIKGE
jgi:tRNA-splicing ligase RtcB